MLDIDGAKLNDCDIVIYNINGKLESDVVVRSKKCLKLDGTTIVVTKKFVQTHQLKIVKDNSEIIAVRIKQLTYCNEKCRYYPACTCNLIEINKKYTRIKTTTFINRHCPYYTEYYLQNLKDAR